MNQTPLSRHQAIGEYLVMAQGEDESGKMTRLLRL